MERKFVFCSVFLLFGSAGVTRAANWPRFRGPEARGLGTGENVPTEFGPDKNVLWRVPLPIGVSSPCIWGDRIYITAYKKNKNELAFYCIDRKSGRILFERNPGAKRIEKAHPISSPASATPTTDGHRVYVFFGSIGLLCYDMAGNELWRVPLGPFTFLFEWGEASSPLLCGDVVIQNCDNDGDSFLISVDKRTGKINWRTERPLASVSYATPTLWDTGQNRRLVIVGSGRVQFYDPATGQEVAWVTGLPRIMIPTPVVADGLLYVVGWSRGGSGRDVVEILMIYKDKNKDGKLSRDELPEGFRPQFDRGDVNKDGVLAGAELKETFSQKGKFPGGGSLIMAIRSGGTGDITGSHVVWKYDRGAPYVPSPLVVNGRLYIVKDGGIASCFDAKTGQHRWNRVRLGSVGAYYTSPVTADGKVYFASERGVVTVVAESPEFKKLAKNDLKETIMATPAILDGRIYLRTAEALYCIGKP